MNLNKSKCHLLAGHKYKSIWAIIDETKTWESNKQKLLGVQIDKYLSLKEGVSNLYKKAGWKLSVFTS